MGRVSTIQAGRYNPPTDVPFYGLRLQMERLYNLRMVERRMVEGCMRVESDGRAYLDPAPSTVGAGEIRASLRPRVRPNRDATGDALRDAATLDRRGMGTFRRTVAPLWLIEAFGAGDALRIMEGAGRVETVEAVRIPRNPQPRHTSTDAGTAYLARLASLGADLSLASGDA